jgi:hypothetical protein
MKTDPHLSMRLALASRELRAQCPPATLLPAIHRRLARGPWKAKKGVARWSAWVGWAGLSTATVALAAVLIVISMLAGDDTGAPAVADTDGFVRLVSQDAWQQARAQDGATWLVTTDVPQARLAALGLPYDPSRAGERVPAQLLMHSSGEVLAVRLAR